MDRSNNDAERVDTTKVGCGGVFARELWGHVRRNERENAKEG